jgi:integrase
MASVFKRSRWVDAKGKKCKKGTLGARLKESKNYTIEIIVNGRPKRIKGYTDEKATKQYAARLERQIAQGAEGLIDIYAPHRRRPLAEHISDYVAELTTLNRAPAYVYVAGRRLKKLREDCRWLTLAHINADSFCSWREKPIKQKQADSEDRTIGPRTLNQYLETLRSFCRWCVKRKRMPTNPVADVEMIDETGDVRRERRALGEEGIVSLLAAVPEPHKTVYRFLLSTGLRRNETASLVWGDVRLNSPRPFIQLRAKTTKAKRADVVPLRSDLAAELTKMRGDAGDEDMVFQDVPTIDQHREYLTKAEIDWKDEQGRRVDIHALRHTYGTLLTKSGASPRETMELMRHSSLSLTMGRYTDPSIFNLAGAVERLPLPVVAPTAKVLAAVETAATAHMEARESGSESGSGKYSPIGNSSAPICTITPKTDGGNTSQTQRVTLRPTGTCDVGGTMRHVGLEDSRKSQDSRRKQRVCKVGTVKAAGGLDVPSDLQRVIDAWPSLPDEVHVWLVTVATAPKTS